MPAITWDSNHGPFDPQFGALPVIPRLRYGMCRFDGILVPIDVQVGYKGTLNNILFVSSQTVTDSVSDIVRLVVKALEVLDPSPRRY